MKEDKELIKQLESVGFRELGTTDLVLSKTVGEYSFNYSCNIGVLYVWFRSVSPSKLVCQEKTTTFPQILEAIKEHTGVDLTPKTKREEIEELKRLVGDLDKENNAQSEFIASNNVRLLKLEDAIKSQNKVIEENRKEAHRANDRLTMVLRRLERLGVWKDEECKQAAEMQAEEAKKIRGFEVGDRVILSGSTVSNAYESVLNAAIVNLSVCSIKEVVSDGYWVSIPFSDEKFWFANFELEHAPAETPKEKALEWGVFAEITEDYELFEKGDIVVISLTDYEDSNLPFYVSCNKSGEADYVPRKILKPL